MLNEWIKNLCCPITKSSLRLLNSNEIKHYNNLITKKVLKYSDGRIVIEKLSAGLATHDDIIYRIKNKIPILNCNEAISEKLEYNIDQLKENSKAFWNISPMDYYGGSLEREIKSKKEWLQYFDKIDSQFYDKASIFSQNYGNPLFSNIIDYNSLNGKKVLEVGCGLGSITKEFALHGSEIVAIDQTLTAANTVMKRLEINNLKGLVICADAENLPFKNDIFDFCWSWGVIHHTPRTDFAANEIMRVLCVSANFKVMVYHRHAFYHWYNIFFIEGILKGKLFSMSFQELRNYCSDNHCPLAQYYTKKDLKYFFRSASQIFYIKAFESREMFLSHFSFLTLFKQINVIKKFIDWVFPDKFKIFLLNKWGHMLFISGEK